MNLAKCISDFKVFFRQKFLEPYFCFWSHLYLKRWRPMVIVITGSVAKTNLLYILKYQLGDQAAHSHRSNTKVGIACNILNMSAIENSSQRWRWLFLLFAVPLKSLFSRVRPESKYLVEYDIYDTGSARHFKWWLKPSICLWTNVSQSHLENFEKLAKQTGKDAFELVVKEFAKIAKSARERIFALANNELMERSLSDAITPVEWLEDELVEYSVDLQKTLFKFKEAAFVFKHPQPKELSQVLTLTQGLMAYLKLPLKGNLTNWRLPPGRSSLLRGYKGCYLLDSSYNAQFEAVLAILSMFESLEISKKWLIFGDMIELGDFAKEAHVEVAGRISDLKLERIFLVGKRTKKYVYPILKKKHSKVYWIEKVDKGFLARLKREIEGEEVILFKGAGFLDILVEALLENQADRKFLNSPGRFYHILH